MKPDPDIQQHLDLLIKQGSTLTTSLSTEAVAAARFLDAQFWYCRLWAETEFDQHWMQVDAAARDGDNINLYSAGQLVATLAPMEPDERDACRWTAWQTDTKAQNYVHELQQAL